MHLLVYRPSYQAQLLFEQTCLSTSHYPKKWEEEEGISLFILFDSIIGLMRLPYLYKEGERIYQAAQKRDNGALLRYETLALIANGAEIIIWCAERNFMVLTPGCSKALQRICYISRMLLYEEVVVKEGRVLSLMWRGKLGQKKEYNQLKMELISHTAYLGWVTLSLITHLTGRSYPRRFMKLLHIVSFYFGLVASGYNTLDAMRYKKNIQWLPKRSIYCS